ncbi:hypothetical protein [Martelella limonii]|uniref:hypothetical protein n=1 Tax=Martelella limonii TaxID=1647649 RepID=UPI0019D69B24|nr:hypothetical protein [Martelella limonii]
MTKRAEHLGSLLRMPDGPANAFKTGRIEMGFFRTAYKNLTDARQRQAERYVADALMRLDDASLSAMGKSRAELNRERARRSAF